MPHSSSIGEGEGDCQFQVSEGSNGCEDGVEASGQQSEAEDWSEIIII